MYSSGNQPYAMYFTRVFSEGIDRLEQTTWRGFKRPVSALPSGMFTVVHEQSSTAKRIRVLPEADALNFDRHHVLEK